MSVAVLCPSRDRPEGLVRLCRSVRDTRAADARVLAYIDEDQAQLYRESMPEDLDSVLELHHGERIGPAQSANELIRRRPEFQIYGLMTDDSWILTPGWDRWMLEAMRRFPKGITVFSPWHNQGNHVDMPFCTKPWIELVGWYAYPRMFHYCWPILVGLIGEMSSLVHCPQNAFGIVHEYEHHTNLERAKDDAEQFFEFVALRLPNYVEKVRNALHE